MMLDVGYAAADDDDDDCSYFNKKHYYDADRFYLQVISQYYIYQISLDIAALT
jgi:hypothetical protein